MKAGKLRHVIRLERATFAPDAYGTPVETWSTLAILRAQKLSEAKAERIEGAAGAVDTVRIEFKTRAFAGVNLADRLVYLGKAYDLIEISEGDFTEGRGLHLTCGAAL
jgi:head-tail adaptor